MFMLWEIVGVVVIFKIRVYYRNRGLVFVFWFKVDIIELVRFYVFVFYLIFLGNRDE